ncbi:MAG: CHAT domain-containing tetratricopeptide repeat protein [Agriterribacter sp.]
MRKTGLFIIIFVLGFFISRSGDPVYVAGISRLYTSADSLFTLSQPSNETDSLARNDFDGVIAAFVKEPSLPDSFLFNALWKRGVLEELLGNFEKANVFYLKSLKIAADKPGISDSLEFKPLLYAGGIYYRENKFDSTRILLEKAQALTEKYQFHDELERLYNILGALYFEGGNYLQSKNCFEKALQLIENDESSAGRKINFETNIAASLNRLGRYQEALESYFKLLKYKKYTEDISLNIGSIYMAMHKYPEALEFFHNSKTDARIDVFNYIANAHLMQQQYDSANYYLQLFEEKLQEKKTTTSKIAIGLHEIYKGDYNTAIGNIPEANHQYQKAIIALMYDFADSNVYKNPTGFSGTISSFNLFNAIIKKAGCFEKLYEQDKNVKNLKAAMDAYLSAISLTDYLERTMESDEAKIFLKKNSSMAYNKALDMVMLLYGFTHDKELLWKAYSIIERNKSSVLVSNLKAFEVKSKMQVPEELLQQERDLKYKIARAEIMMDKTSESDTSSTFADDKRNNELKLSDVQKKIRQYTSKSDLQEDEHFLSHERYFKHNLKEESAILDFYFSDNILYVFAITNNNIQPNIIPVKDIDLKQVEHLQNALQHIEKISERTSDSVLNELYTKLIAPIFPLIKDKKEWIVLPDRAFYYFPFEIITNPETGRMLIEDYALSYNFSTQFIAQHVSGSKSKDPKLIAMAPFISKGLYSYADSILLDRLPATNMEISGLKGNILKDTTATKSKFINAANHYDILHLATHAVMDGSNPSQSYIAFYPEDSTRQDSYKLYLNELYSLNLDSTHLMLLSACETGVGKFVEGEGVMSLSRGVLYAGCPSVITTLWPANDQSTAYIVNHFYRHMDEGNDLTTALRLSKLDFIKDYPNQKNPSYWAHLILVGQTQALYDSSWHLNMPFVVTILVVMLLIGMSVKRWISKRAQKKV